MKPRDIFKRSRETFKAVCRDIWGDEWHPQAAKTLKVSRRTIVHWSNGDHSPKDWDAVLSVLAGPAARESLQLLNRADRLQEFAARFSH